MMTASFARLSRPGSPAEAGSPLKVGDVLAGKYRVERVLGEGGMGVVVAAYHELLDQRVAVKLLYRELADGEAQSRLLLEARSAAKLQSEHVARVIDVDTGADGLPFIVMELLEGADLCQLADAQGAFPRWLVVDYILQALEGLSHAHARGIVHRDLKPSNFFLANRPDGSQVIKLLDFGISKSIDTPGARRANQLTGGREVLGSPPYMSPEQVRTPKSVDHRSDIWQIGICMYELLTNSMPFGGEEIQETFAQILEQHPVPVRNLISGVPEGLERVVMQCLAKKRDDRFRDVAELARALAPFGSGAFAHLPDRIGITLTRTIDEMSSGRVPVHAAHGGHSSKRIALPSSPSLPPSRRVDSMQPELHGTAATLMRTSVLDTKGWLVVAALGIPAVIGLLVGGAALVKMRRSEGAEALTVSEPPADVLAGPATTLVTPPIHTAGPENETPPIEPANVEASPVGSASAASAQAKRMLPVRAGPPKKPVASSSRPALPPGLPPTRQ